MGVGVVAAVMVGLGEGVRVMLSVVLGPIVFAGATLGVGEVVCGLAVGVSDSSVGCGEVGDGSVVGDGSRVRVLVGSRGSSVGCGEVGDG